MLTNIEKEAEWIKKERAMLVKLSNEINAVVLLDAFNRNNKTYGLEYDVSADNHYIEVRVYRTSDFEQVEKLDIWGLDRIFENKIFDTTAQIKRETKTAKAKLRSMKKLADKYIKLNESCQQK